MSATDVSIVTYNSFSLVVLSFPFDKCVSLRGRRLDVNALVNVFTNVLLQRRQAPLRARGHRVYIASFKEWKRIERTHPHILYTITLSLVDLTVNMNSTDIF